MHSGSTSVPSASPDLLRDEVDDGDIADIPRTSFSAGSSSSNLHGALHGVLVPTTEDLGSCDKVCFFFFVDDSKADFNLFHASNQGASSLPATPYSRTDLMYTDGCNKIKLTIQRPLVRLVIQDSIEKTQAKILLTNAFPDGSCAAKFVTDALVSAAKDHLPATRDILVRLMTDNDYISKIIPVVRSYNTHCTRR